MKRFNLYETSGDLKVKLKVSAFYGEGSFKPNANIAPKTCIPVMLRSNDGHCYLQSMKWGMDLFENGKITYNARREAIISDTPCWTSIAHQRAIIICKGFYVWSQSKIYDAIKHITYTDNQPYYVSPQTKSEPFFYIPALFQIKQKGMRSTFAVVAISTSSKHHQTYCELHDRIPFLMRKTEMYRWLHPRIDVKAFLKTCPLTEGLTMKKIGLWVNCPTEHKEEDIVLQSKEKWVSEQKAMTAPLDDDDVGDFDFDLIEREALIQNNKNKLKRKLDAIDTVETDTISQPLKKQKLNEFEM